MIHMNAFIHSQMRMGPEHNSYARSWNIKCVVMGEKVVKFFGLLQNPSQINALFKLASQFFKLYPAINKQVEREVSLRIWDTHLNEWYCSSIFLKMKFEIFIWRPR